MFCQSLSTSTIKVVSIETVWNKEKTVIQGHIMWLVIKNLTVITASYIYTTNFMQLCYIYTIVQLRQQPSSAVYVFHAISFGRDLVTVTKNDSISINLPLVNKVKMLQIDHFTPLYYVQGNKLPWMSISITKIRECSKGARCNSLVCKLKQFHLTS